MNEVEFRNGIRLNRYRSAHLIQTWQELELLLSTGSTSALSTSSFMLPSTSSRMATLHADSLPSHSSSPHKRSPPQTHPFPPHQFFRTYFSPHTFVYHLIILEFSSETHTQYSPVLIITSRTQLRHHALCTTSTRPRTLRLSVLTSGLQLTTITPICARFTT